MKPHLMNYTTSVPASRSIAEIQELLFAFGATSIVLDADANRRPSGIRFLYTVNGRTIPFSLPVKIERTTEVLYTDYCKVTKRGRKTHEDFAPDAERIAWRILRDWVHAQVSILTIEAAGFIDVFAGYLVTNMETCETLGNRFENGKLDRLLGEASQ